MIIRPSIRRLSLFSVPAVVVVAALFAACGDDDSTTAKTTTAPATTAATTAAASSSTAGASSPTAAASSPTTAATTATSSAVSTVRIATAGTVGQVLTDPSGRTLYTFKNDTPGSGQSACSGSCATTWPPFAPAAEPVSKPAGLSGDLAVITRADGTKQVTYKGSPLYRFSGDQAAGDTKGQGIGNIWFVAAP